MTIQPIIKARWLMIIVMFGILTACTSPYSEHAYRNATELKVASLSLLSKATDPYSKHAAQAEKLIDDLEVAYEYAKGLSPDDARTKVWFMLRDPEDKFVTGTLNQWKERKQFSAFHLVEIKPFIARAFDRVICLEANKKAVTDCIE